MSTILLILIILICLLLSFFVLIQNPKGGGMAGTFGGFGNSVMGAKQSSEGVEKATWTAMAVLAAVVLLSFVLMEKPTNTKSTGNEAGKPLKATTAPIQAPTPPPPAATGTAPTGAQNGGATQSAPAGQQDGKPTSGNKLPQPSAGNSK